MNYPLISEYIDAIKSAEDNFEELSHLRPVLDASGIPVMSSGNFAVVFKMKSETDGKLYAVKCFTKEQEERSESYKLIAEELESVTSDYLIPIKFYEKDLFVDTSQTDDTEFPVLLMDWVEGKTLDKYLRENIHDKYALEMLAYRFSLLASWLIPQPFAHGDLKPDNILVRDNGSLVLVDYDGMFVPSMKGQKARELGSPDFRHPLRTENDFDEHIDDFSIASILLSLKAIAINPLLLDKYGAADRLLFSAKDYLSIDNNPVINKLFMVKDNKVHDLLCRFTIYDKNDSSFTPPIFDRPYKAGYVLGHQINGTDILIKPTKDNLKPLAIDNILNGLVELDCLMIANDIDYVLTGSLALYIHGFTPDNYVPHDIDIAIIDSENKHPKLTNHMILDLFSYYCGYHRFEYAYNDPSELFKYYLGNPVVEVNAFINRNHITTNSEFCVMSIRGRKIKVHKVLPILKAKYILHRIKDFEFNNEIQNIINGYLCKQSNKSEDIYTDSYIQPKSYDKNLLQVTSRKIDLNSSKETVELLSTKVTDKDLAEAWVDEFGAKYSKDRKRFIKTGNYANNEILHGTLVICDSAYENCKQLMNIKIPNTIKVIGSCAFYNCNSLISVILPEGLTHLDWYTFSDCKSLHKVYLPNSLRELWGNSFAGCSSIASINLPNNLNFIGQGCFNDCSSLFSISIPYKIEYIENDTFGRCTNLQEVYLPDNLNCIMERAFADCTSLKSIIFPPKLNHIGIAAFANCNSLECIQFLGIVDNIDCSAFIGCTSLTQVLVPYGSINKYEQIFDKKIIFELSPKADVLMNR